MEERARERDVDWCIACDEREMGEGEREEERAMEMDIEWCIACDERDGPG